MTDAEKVEAAIKQLKQYLSYASETEDELVINKWDLKALINELEKKNEKN